jgi:hypothetical protein
MFSLLELFYATRFASLFSFLICFALLVETIISSGVINRLRFLTIVGIEC